jgi:hypothetical protein
MNTAQTEYHVYLVNADGKQASVPWMRIQGGDRKGAIKIALAKHCKNFNLIEQASSPEGYSEQRVATVRNGVDTQRG